MVSLLAIAGCGPGDERGTGGGGPASSNNNSSSSTGTIENGTFVRIHYRLQGDGDVKSWGVHFWGAGSTSPEWGSPQLFTETDDFGVYTDVKVTATEDMADAWLGVLPVQCSGTDCKKDVETSVRYVDLAKDAASPGIAECWITQGQAVQTTKPTSTGPAYKIYRSSDFIDLGDGRVRMMFRVAKGSTGTVEYGSAEGALDKKASWTETSDINKDGLLLSGLAPGAKVYYKITSILTVGKEVLKDETPVLTIEPIEFKTITEAGDWAAWGSKGVMYQLIVRTFADGGSPKTVADLDKDSGIDTSKKDGIGDLVGLKSSLPYLKNLGVDAIWMTPVFKAKTYHGYDTTDFYDIDPAVGTKKDFVDLTAAAGAMGINIILDLVQNHVADVNPWFISGSNPKDPDYAKYHDWFVWSDDYSNMLTDKHPWDASAVLWACKNYMCYHEIFGSPMPELNYHNPAVRAEMKKISAYWIERGADGFRLDASKHIDQFDDNNGIPLYEHGTHVWWKEFNHFVKTGVTLPPGAPPVLLTGENRWDEPANSANMVPYAGEMDSQFDFPFRSFISAFIAGKTGDEVDFAKYISGLRQKAGDPAGGGNPNHYFERFLSNHDLTRPATELEGEGSALTARLKQAATIVLTVPGMPVIYYGEEFGKKGKRDKYLGTEGWDHDEFIREPMSWFESVTFTGDKMASWDIDFAATNAANAAVALPAGICRSANPDYPFIKFMTESDPASWTAQKDDDESLYAYYKTLIAIRKANAVMTDQDTQIVTAKNTADLLEVTLSKGGESIAVLLNRKATVQTIARAVEATDLITGVKAMSFDMPAYGSLILK